MRILVCGAGVAGNVLACLLARAGHEVVVAERRPEGVGLRGGHSVDLFGPALDVMDRLGLGQAVRDHATHTRVLTLFRAQGRPVPLDLEATLGEATGDRHVEIFRGDLVRLLEEAAPDDVGHRYGDAVTGVRDVADGVEVTFRLAPPERFDLVVGADGLHSAVRQAAFGPEDKVRHFLGGYLAVATIPAGDVPDGHLWAYNAVDRLVATYPAGAGEARVLFVLRDAEQPVGRRDAAAQRAFLEDRFSGQGWLVPELLRAALAADDLYLDEISQIRADEWTTGRVALVGDAGYSPGPAVGGGTSLAVVGAYVLATALAGTDDHTAAFARYTEALRGYVEASRRVGPNVMASIVPRSSGALAAKVWAMRALPHLPAGVRRRLLASDDAATRVHTSFDLPEPASRS